MPGRSLLLRSLAALALWLGTAPGEARPASSLSSSVTDMLAEERLAGAVWSLLDGERTEVGAAGRSHAERGTPMSVGQRVHVGSVAKTLVALGILRLVTEGRLDLDRPVSDLLPDLALRNPWQSTHPLRLRHLLDHTAGLENLRLWQFFSGQVGADDPLMSQFVRSPGVLRVRSRPGEMFSYSNVGYGLAGLIIERTTGERYESWLDAHLLAPLGMRESTFGFVTQIEGPGTGLAWGHLDDLTAVPALPVALRPAGQFTTTAADMARLAAFLMSDGDVGGSAWIRPDLLRAMGMPDETAAAQAGLPVGYALGLGRRDRNGRLGRCHSGSIVGYHAMFCIYPRERKAFFYSINTDSETADYGRFDGAMMEALSLRRLPTAPEGVPAANLRAWHGYYVPAVSGIRIERYADLLLEGVNLDLTGRRPMLHQGGAPRPIEYAGGHRLRAVDRVLPSHVLLRGDDGSRMLSDGYRTYRKTGRWLIHGMWASLVLGGLSLIYFMFALPVIGWRKRRSALQPGFLAMLPLVVAAWLMFRQPFEQLGDLTPGSAVLFAATLAMPAGVLVQAVLALRKRFPLWRIDLVAAAAALQWSAILASFDLLPLMLWR